MCPFHSGQTLLTHHYNEGAAKKTALLGRKFLPSLPQDIERPVLPKFRDGRITIRRNGYTMKAAEISQHIISLPADDYCSENTKLLANRQFRMLFQNMLEEDDPSDVSNTMVPLRKEIDRMFYRIYQQHQCQQATIIEKAPIESIHTNDMPYRSIGWVRAFFTLCQEINDTRTAQELNSYEAHILHTEYEQVQIENKYNAREKQCEDRNLDFAQVIDLFHCEQVQDSFV